jgi:cell division protein FtsQ
MNMERSQTTLRKQAERSTDTATVKWDVWGHFVRGAWQAMMIGILISGGYLALPWLKVTFDKPIAKVIIKGDLQALNEKSIRDMIAIYENDTFLSIDLGVLVDRIEMNSWVAHARARRQWPDTLEVTLIEEKPIAYWGDKGMLNAKGRVFDHQGLLVERTLPRLWSELGSPAETMSYYQIFEEQLEPVNLKLHSISQSVQGDWRLQLDNQLLVILDRADPVGNIKNFVSVYTQLLSVDQRHAMVVDMRYRHGAAIRWQEPTHPVVDSVNKVSSNVSNTTMQAISVGSISSEAKQEWQKTKAI